MNKSDFRVLEFQGKYYVERQFDVEKIVSEGFLRKTKYRTTKEWHTVDEKGFKPCRSLKTLNWINPPNRHFKSLEYAKSFIEKICESNKCHYPFKED